MSKLYLFGIGGTGARVIKSLVMLLASGVDCGNNIDTIVPVLIDPDKANGDLTRSITLLKKYQTIRKNLSFGENVPSKFFKTAIEDQDTSFRLSIANTSNKTFGDYISYINLDKANKSLISLLFSQKILDSSMEVGFKGNPNMGSVVLNNLKDNNNPNSLKALLSNFCDGDKIFIISSIFGGTGAAGFPLLLKTLREAQIEDFASAAFLRDAPIGAITVLPYFGVKDDQNSEIKMETFISKAKSALTYYQENINVNALYYISDDLKSQYENVEGDKEQQNCAHFIELASALSIVDFAKSNIVNSIEGVQQIPVYKEFAVQADKDPLIFTDLEKSTRVIIEKPMIQFFMFAQHFQNHLSTTFSDAWAKDKGISSSILSEEHYRILDQFIHSYITWLDELRRNKRSFAPFNLEITKNNLLDSINGIEPRKASLMQKFTGKNHEGVYAIDNEMANVSKYLFSKLSREDYFMSVFYQATNNLTLNKFNI